MSPAQILAHLAAVQGDAIAQIFENKRTTYLELNQRANRIGSGLIGRGCAPLTRLAVLAKNGDYQSELLFGAAKAGCTLVFINWRLTTDEIAHILADAEPGLVFVESQFLKNICDAASGVKINFEIIVLDQEVENFDSYGKWLNTQVDSLCIDQQPADADLLQIYTSGTTGKPKGVVITNSNVMAMLREVMAEGWARWEPSTKQLVCMPLFHIGGISLALVGLLQGCTNVVLPEAKVGAIMDAIADHRIAKVFLVPSVLNSLSQEIPNSSRDLSSLDLVLYGAAPISEQLLIRLQKMLSCKFAQLYGMTELTGAVTCLSPEDHDPSRCKLRSCGRPNPGVQVCIRDSGHAALPPLGVGEICVKGKSVMKCYWRNETATEETIRDGWLHTGDVGYLDSEGYLFVQDRAKDVIVCGAENIYPAEIENAVRCHPSIEDIAVIGVPDEKWGECVKAVAVLKDGCAMSFEELVGFLRGTIAGYKIPKSLDIVVDLPRTSSGKISKNELRAPYWIHLHRKVN